MTDPIHFRQSLAKILLLQCPAACKWQIDNGFKEPTKPMRFGSVVDQLVFGGGNYHEVGADSWRTKAAREQRDGAIARGQTPVLSHELELARPLAGQIRAAMLGHDMPLEWCDKQVTLTWTSPEGVLCEGTPDLAFYEPLGAPVIDGSRITETARWCVVDAKAGANGNPDYLDNHVVEMGWDIQAAAYEEAGNVLYPETIGHSSHAIVHATSGDGFSCVQWYPFSELMMDLGRARWAQAKEIWSQCLKTGVWPEYQSRPLTPPRRHVYRWLGDSNDVSDLGLVQEP